jgi:hypothetical protein
MKPRWLGALLLAVLLPLAGLACRAGSALPALFATPTFTPTMTLTPTPTATTTPTPPPTSTPVPTGSQLLEQVDGTRLFMDYDGGYQVLIPEFWTPLDLSATDLQEAASQAGDTNPDLKNLLETVKNLDPETFRLLAYSHDVVAHGYLTNINILMMQDNMACKLPLDFIIEATVEQIKSQLPGATIVSGGVKTNKNGIEIATVEVRNLSMNMPGGTAASLYEKQFYFMQDDNLVIITMATSSDTAQQVLPHFDELFDAIAPIE